MFNKLKDNQKYNKIINEENKICIDLERKVC